MRSPRLTLALLLLAALPVRAGDPPGKAEGAGPLPSLRDAYRKDFDIGVSLAGRVPDSLPEPLRALVRTQFAVVTPENCLKMDHVQRTSGTFDFGDADALVGYATRAGLKVVGHCLVWAKDERTPAWIFRDGDKPADRDLLLTRMRTHIQTVVGRYKGRIGSWDVVNEPIADDGPGDLRPSTWSRVLGDDLLAKSFEYAHEADPDAVLILNDYNVELQPAKRERLLRVLGRLRDRGVPIQAVGLQGHFELDAVPMASLNDTLAALRGMRMKVVISELDLDVIPRSGWWADGGKHRDLLAKLDPYRDGCPPQVLKRQADQYADLFHLLRVNGDVIDRVTFWNLHDGESWLNSFPWKRVNHPLLFDRAGRPKPAFWAVVGAG